MTRSPKVYVEDILESIEKIESYVAGKTLNEFDRNTVMQDAVIRRLEIIGEAVRYLPAALRQKYPTVPWRQISDMRNVLIHEYAGVSLETVWLTVQNHLGLLKSVAEKILQEEILTSA